MPLIYLITVILPNMLAQCSMLSGTHYAQNYASIIGWLLAINHDCLPALMCNFN